ncbi:MAG TPA: DUF1365 domain-containing protein [Burkholderiaceae bacterium]|nr:DUF1365 domain-containing protein [Burkholderiaceae bacterium]
MPRSDPLAPLADPDWRLVFGEVLHRRLRPSDHAFRYPVFYVRVPVHHLDGSARGNWLFGLNRPALLSFRESDHGDGRGCAAWVRSQLADAGIAADGPLWLYTFARVLGYVFKPVSFWHCHDRDGRLMAVLAEVNNTFGERHAYLLSDPSGAPLRRGQTLRAEKAFHVSPFNEVIGGYRFRFMDTAERTVARVEHHDEAGPVLLTSLSGRPERLSRRHCWRALLRYPLFTLGVIARIHWQALRLFAQGVPFQSKPAPPARFLTRGSP